ncbi:MAG TPA: ABC transporter permease [Gemmatimonadales bacterium]|jgi:simple sugar transport system permease protein|nr:ABC transporter permease [Gemmatimonadales bacterium]
MSPGVEAGALVGFLAASVRVATPLLFAAIGETVTERAGVINLGLEGAMLAGALASALGASGGPWAGVAAAAVAGAAVAAVFAGWVVGARVNQIIAGTAVTLACVGLTGTIYRQAYGAGGPGLSLPTLGPLPVPGLSRIPVLGPALFAQPALTYVSLALVPIVWWMLYRTRVGLALRATGEASDLARAAGVPVGRLRFSATVFGGALAGLGGASLVLAQVGTFAEKMTAGRGYVAIAIVVLGRWHPAGVALAALLFGAATALQFLFQSLGLAVPYQFFLMLPYVLTLLALAGAVGRVQAPAGLAKDE